MKLKLLSGSQAGRELSLPFGKYVVGRGEHCHLRPKSTAVSRQHCAFVRVRDHVTVVDLNSRNGTHVNGQRILSELNLRPGDRIAVGPLQFEFVVAQDDRTVMANKDDGMGCESDCGSDTLSAQAMTWLEEANELDREQTVCNDVNYRRFDAASLRVPTTQDASQHKTDVNGISADSRNGSKDKARPGFGQRSPRHVETSTNACTAAHAMLRKMVKR